MEPTPASHASPPAFAGHLPEIHRRRLLTWSACANVRDLGGLPLNSGGTTRWRAVVRADDLCRLTAAGQSALLQYGVRTVIDLRAHYDLSLGRHPYRPPYTGVPAYLHLPPTGDATAPLPAIVSAPSITDGYVRALELRRQRYGAVLSAIAEAPEGGLVVHCVSGKDRTGLAVALLLSLVGVPDSIIAEDYALSALFLQGRHPDNPPGGRAGPVAEGRDAVLSPPEAILAALAFVRERFGGVEEYLRGAGVSMENLQRIRTKMTVT